MGERVPAHPVEVKSSKDCTTSMCIAALEVSLYSQPNDGILCQYG